VEWHTFVGEATIGGTRTRYSNNTPKNNLLAKIDLSGDLPLCKLARWVALERNLPCTI